MSTVLQTKVKRQTKVMRDGKKVTLMPGDVFPYDPQDRAHRKALENNRLELVPVECGGADVDAILERVRGVSGVGPALFAKIEEAVRGDS